MWNFAENIPEASLDSWHRWLTYSSIAIPILGAVVGGICGWGSFTVSNRIGNLQSAKMQTELEDEVKKNAARRLNKEQHDEIAGAVRRQPPIRVTVGFDGNDAEASAFAADLITSLDDGGAIVFPQPSAVFIGQMPVFGLLIQPSQTFDATAIESAISTAVPIGKSDSLKSFPAQSRADIFLYVGHKARPQ
jgi:hypothetical protein